MTPVRPGRDSASGKRAVAGPVSSRVGTEPFFFMVLLNTFLPSICHLMASPFLNIELENALARSNCWMDQEHSLVCSASLPLFFHRCSVLPRNAVITFFLLRGCLVSNASSHHSLPSSFNFLALYFNVLSQCNYEARRLQPCHQSYDTLNPGHCMSFSLWVYLFILSLQIPREGIIDSHPNLASELLADYKPSHPVTTDFVIYVVYLDQRLCRRRKSMTPSYGCMVSQIANANYCMLRHAIIGNGCQSVKRSSFELWHQGQVLAG